jgi:pre-mRNA-processing factor SLU7
MAREEKKKQQELEEARKAGLAQPAVDEEGKEINPHIPQFMSATPWYMNEDRPTLRHQRNWNQASFDDHHWYDRGAKTHQATRFRKGACSNCGALTHASKHCTERPRHKGAKLTSKGIAPDEKIQSFELSYDGKRDRYNGFDPATYKEVMDWYDRIEQKKREKALQQERERVQAEQRRVAENGSATSAADADDAKIDDSAQQSFDKVEKRVRSAGGGATMSVRNLRIREDTAKYLLNLDTDSAYYDPKTRAMREDPTPHIDPSQKGFAGENAIRGTGETEYLAKLHRHAAEANQEGQDIHVQAMPSQAEKVYKEFAQKHEKLSSKAQSSLIERYGNAAEDKQAPDELLFGQSEAYAEYDSQGNVIRGEETAVPRSRYEEDVLENNHTQIFGSYFCNGYWGYACCKSTLRNSYCLGEAGKEANEQELLRASNGKYAQEQEQSKRAEAKQLPARDELSEEARQAAERLKGSKDWRGTDADGEEPVETALDEGKVRELVQEEKTSECGGQEQANRAKSENDRLRKRRYNVMHDAEEPTEEDMETYMRTKVRREDPMAEMLHAS